MNQQQYNGHTVELYDSIDELPICRFQKYNKYLLIDSGVGSDIQDVLTRIERAKLYVKANPDMAVTELDNLKQALYLVSEEMSPKNLAFAVLVSKIDGEPTDDLTDAGLKRTLEKLNTAPRKWMDGILEAVKKKLIKKSASISRDGSRARHSKNTTTP